MPKHKSPAHPAHMFCSRCGVEEYVHLIDLKEGHPGSGNYDRPVCIKCHGPGWNPVDVKHIALSIVPALKPFYDQYMKEFGRHG